MKKCVVLLLIFCFFSCTEETKITPEYLSGKTFEKRGYAEDQISPDEAKANPQLAKTLLTSLAEIEFLDEENVQFSYYFFADDGIPDTMGTYTIEGNKIFFNVKSVGTIFGNTGTFENPETLVTDGQISDYTLRVETFDSN